MSVPSFRVSRTGRGCPVCTESRCVDPAECLWFLLSRPWGDCDACFGSGWASEDDPLSLFCRCCFGSGLDEHTPESVQHQVLSAKAEARYASYVAALRDRVATNHMAVGA